MRRTPTTRPILFLSIVVLMVLGISNVALADEPVVDGAEAITGQEAVEGQDGVIVRDDERPPAVEPDIAPEPGAEEPMVISPAPGIEEPTIVNPEGTIGIEENIIAPAPGTSTGSGWSTDDFVAAGLTALATLIVGAGVAFVLTRKHYRHEPLAH